MSRTRVALNLDLDEGKQFHLGEVKVLGMDATLAGRLLRQHHLQPGAVFDDRNVKEFARDWNLTPEDDIERRIDERSGTVALLIDVRACR